jgi:hypothetical protein
MPKAPFPDQPYFSWMAWGMLKTCPRRWFLHNFGRELPAPDGPKFYAERKLSYWNAFAGQLADDGVTELIRHFKKHGVWRQDMADWLHKQALEYRKDSLAYTEAAQAGAELPYVKRQVLDKYYWGEVPDAAEHRRVLSDARAAVEAFLRTDIPHRIESAPREALMCDHKDGGFPWASHEGVPVFAVYDFAIKTPDLVTIFDWKTGKLTPEKAQAALEQLHWYALYAIETWGYRPDQIRLASVFLSTTYGYDETEPDPETLQGIRNSWKERHCDIKDLMQKNPNPSDLQECFPMTENLRECAGCVFRSCPGYGRIPR